MKRTLALALLALSACGKGPDDPRPTMPRHIYTWAWRLVDGTHPRPEQAPPVSCREVGASWVGMAFEPQGTGMPVIPYESPCTPTGRASSDPLPDGRYRIAAAVLDSKKKILNSVVFDDELGDDVEFELLFPLLPL